MGGLLRQTALRNSSFTPMVPRSSLRCGRAVLRVPDGVSSCWDLTWWRSQTSLGSSECSVHVGGSVFDLRAVCTSG